MFFRDPQSEKKLTGGANWMPQVAPTSWGTPGAPMVRAARTPSPPPWYHNSFKHSFAAQFRALFFKEFRAVHTLFIIAAMMQIFEFYSSFSCGKGLKNIQVFLMYTLLPVSAGWRSPWRSWGTRSSSTKCSHGATNECTAWLWHGEIDSFTVNSCIFALSLHQLFILQLHVLYVDYKYGRHPGHLRAA